MSLMNFGPGSTITSNWLNAVDVALFGGGGSPGTVTSFSFTNANGITGTVTNATSTPALTLGTSLTGLVKAGSGAFSAATSGVDYAPATTGSSILYANGSGGFSAVTVGSGLSFTTGTLSATGGGSGTVTSVSVVSANGFAGTVATSTTTPAITLTTSITGLLKGSASAIVAATAGTDYSVPTGTETLTNKTLTAPVVNGYTETVTTANSGTAYTFSLTSAAMFYITLTGNVTFTMPTAAAGKSFIVFTKQDATGSRTITWSSVTWPGGTAPTVTATASKADKWLFQCFDGSTWHGVDGGRNF